MENGKRITLGKYNNFLFLLPILCVTYGIIHRFYNIFSIGIYGSDNFYYWQTAYEWATDGPKLTQHYRPLIYLIDAIILKATNYSDWGIRLFNALIDCLSGFFLLKISKVNWKTWLPGFMAWGLFFLLPHVTNYTRTEMVHSPSTFFILLSFYFLSKAQVNLCSKHFFLTGLALSCAWNLHPDLGVLGLPFFLYIFYLAKSIEMKRIIKILSSFIIGYASVFIFFFIFFKPEHLLKNLVTNSKHQHHKMAVSYFEKFIEVFSKFYLVNLSTLILGITLITTAVYLFALYKKKSNYQFEVLVHSSVLTYCVFCTFLFSKKILSRLFIPFTPLILLSISRVILFRKHPFLSILFYIGLMSSIIFQHKSPFFFNGFYSKPSLYKILDNQIGKNIDKNNRLLVTPFVQYNVHTPFHKNVYFNGEAKYISLIQGETWGDILSSDIQYVFISNTQYDLRLMSSKYSPTFGSKLANLYNLDKNTYDVDRDKEITRKMLKKNQFQIIWKNPIGELYQRI